MDNYVLAQSWARANVQDRLWYCMIDTDKALQEYSDTSGKVDKSDIVQTTGQSETAIMSQKAVCNEFNLTNRVLTSENVLSLKCDVIGQTVEVPAYGSTLSAVVLKVNTGTISTVIAVIRYDGDIDGNGVKY